MTSKIHQRNRSYWEKNGFRNLLFCLFLYLVVGPFFDQAPYADFIVSSALSLTLISAIGAMAESRKRIEFASIVLGIALILLWLKTLGIISDKGNFASVAIAGFLLILIFSFGHRLLKVRKVTGNVICSALCLYILVGLLWGSLYAIIDSLIPGSFAGVLINESNTFHQNSRYFQYFSFMTLSTVGYGDITPRSMGATVLCQTEAILGQIIIVVLVARLVGIQVAQQVAGKEDDSNSH
ncbi:potassium channel family protein [Haloferula sp.]|uniref:potassium channel family protein n=1 Tax=Haloferula sp. TaxID=2497595 RepID=UPI003C74E3B0